MTLVLLEEGQDARTIARVPAGEATREQPLRDLIFAYPAILPFDELEPGIGRVIPVAIEVNLPGAGFIDVLLISEHGRLIIVECKLWRNPQARREVVGQVLDYARELSRYAYEDLQRVVSSRLHARGNVLYELAQQAGTQMTEAAFVDRITRDLRAGRFLLLIVGDGITEGTQRIGEYLGAQAGLAFDFGLIEMAEYRFEDRVTGTLQRIMQPRLLARTAVIERHVIRSEVPGITVEEVAEVAAPGARSRPTGTGPNAEAHAQWRALVQRFVAQTSFDDPAQLPARVGGINWMRLPLPGRAHLTLWRSGPGQRLGAQLSYTGAEGYAVYEALAADRESLDAEFVGDGLPAPDWLQDGEARAIRLVNPAPTPWQPADEDAQLTWFERVSNRFVNSFRPRLLRLEGAS